MSLSLQSAVAVVKTERNPYRRDEELLVHQRDLIAPFGVSIDEQLLREGTNITFVELAEALLAELPTPLAKPDMIIVGYGLPDSNPFKTIAAHLDHLLGGGSCCFAISEQGLAAPFTALKVADAYARSGRCRSLALFVLEQQSFAYRQPTPSLDSAALVQFGEGPGYQLTRVDRTRPNEPVAALLRDPDALVVAGPSVDLDGIDAEVHRVSPGSYCTSVWLDLARHQETWLDKYPTVLLCDTDPRSGRSHLAELRRQP